MARWDNHVKQTKQERLQHQRDYNPTRPRAVNPVRAVRKPQPKPEPKPAPSIFERIMPVEVVSLRSTGYCDCWQHLGPEPATAVPRAFERLGAETIAYSAPYWRNERNGAPPQPIGVGSVDGFWGTGFALRGLLAEPTDISKELQQEREAREENEREEEYQRIIAVSEWSWSECLRLAKESPEIEMLKLLASYFDAREAERLRAKGIRKPRKLLEEKWKGLALQRPKAEPPDLWTRQFLRQLRESPKLLLEAMQENGFRERLELAFREKEKPPVTWWPL
jgi:hypothetical protein